MANVFSEMINLVVSFVNGPYVPGLFLVASAVYPWPSGHWNLQCSHSINFCTEDILGGKCSHAVLPDVVLIVLICLSILHVTISESTVHVVWQIDITKVISKMKDILVLRTQVFSAR